MVSESLDVADEAAVASFAAQVTESLGPIDVWINNAGILQPIRPVRNVSADELLQHLNINVVGVLNGTRAFSRLVRERETGGVLINISSGAGRPSVRRLGGLLRRKGRRRPAHRSRRTRRASGRVEGLCGGARRC